MVQKKIIAYKREKHYYKVGKFWAKEKLVKNREGRSPTTMGERQSAESHVRPAKSPDKACESNSPESVMTFEQAQRCQRWPTRGPFRVSRFNPQQFH